MKKVIIFSLFLILALAIACKEEKSPINTTGEKAREFLFDDFSKRLNFFDDLYAVENYDYSAMERMKRFEDASKILTEIIESPRKYYRSYEGYVQDITEALKRERKRILFSYPNEKELINQASDFGTNSFSLSDWNTLVNLHEKAYGKISDEVLALEEHAAKKEIILASRESLYSILDLRDRLPKRLAGAKKALTEEVLAKGHLSVKEWQILFNADRKLFKRMAEKRANTDELKTFLKFN